MWKDINGKTGYKGLQGNTKTYGNLKIIATNNPAKLQEALDDGITLYTPPAKTPPSLEHLKDRKRAELSEAFMESVKSFVVISNGATFVLEEMQLFILAQADNAQDIISLHNNTGLLTSLTTVDITIMLTNVNNAIIANYNKYLLLYAKIDEINPDLNSIVW